MREGWKKVCLGDIIITQKGFAFQSKWYQNDGVPVVRVSDFTENSISSKSINYISKEKEHSFNKYQLNTKDIIIQTVGSWQYNPASIVGKVVRVPKELNKSLLNQNAVKLIPNNKVQKDFLYYYLKTDNFKFHNLNHAQGAANQASITLNVIKRFKIFLPPLPTQRKIAQILSAYDDLIENNLRRIALLEEQAQLTYEEWFVKLRFPGFEEVEVVEGLPVGWRKVKLGEVSTFKYGKMPKKELMKPEGFPIYSGYRVTGFYEKMMFSKPTLIVVARGVGGTGDVKISPRNCWLTNLSIAVFPSNLIKQNYLYYYLKNINLISLDSGAAQSQITITSLENFQIINPSIIIQSKFNDIIVSILNSIENLQTQNRLLQEARDILLPRLMLGIVDVEEVSGQVVEEN